jgi:pimeloyl-ACP methyl ester carboxylesterase
MLPTKTIAAHDGVVLSPNTRGAYIVRPLEKSGMLLETLTLAVESVPALGKSTGRLERRYTNERSAFAELGDTRVHYRTAGDPAARTLVLIHGTYSSLHTWEGWVDELADEYHLVSLDMPGFGLTGPRREGEHTVKHLVDTVIRLCELLALDDIVVAGNSLGGGVGWRLAARRPTLVAGLVLLNAGGGTLLCRIVDSLTTPLVAHTDCCESVPLRRAVSGVTAAHDPDVWHHQ